MTMRSNAQLCELAVPLNHVDAATCGAAELHGIRLGGPNREPFDVWLQRYNDTAPSAQVTMVGAFNTPTAAPACEDCDVNDGDTPNTVEALRQELREIKSALGGVMNAKQALSTHNSSLGSRLSTPSTVRLGAVREDDIAVVPETPSAVPLAQPLQMPSARQSALDLMWQSLEKADFFSLAYGQRWLCYAGSHCRDLSPHASVRSCCGPCYHEVCGSRPG